MAASRPRNVVWSAIVLTCQDKSSADAYRKELEIHQHAGFIDKSTLLLTIEDPKARVGSGGAMLNALLVVTEYLSAKQGSTTLDYSVIEKSRILIMNVGRDYPFSTCGPVFTTLPGKLYSYNNSLVSLADCLVTNFDCLLYYLTNCICKGSPNGVWVCSTDMMLSLPSHTEINWTNITHDVVLVLFESCVKNALHHGVCQLDDQGNVKNIIYKGSEDEVRDCAFDNGKVPLVGSIVYFSVKATEKLLVLHSYPPLDACTYYGLDNGAKPIQISLFFDLLSSMATGVSESDYVSGKKSCAYGKSTRTGVRQMSDEENQLMTGARKTLWKHLRGMKAHAVMMGEGCQYHYVLHQTGVYYRAQMSKCLSFFESANLPFKASSQVHVSVDNSQSIDDKAILINTVIEGSVKVQKEAVITHSYLQGELTIGTGCVLSAIGPNDFKGESKSIPDYLCLLGYNVSLPNVSSDPHKVFVVFGVNDHLDKHVSSGSFCNSDWKHFFQRTGITEDDIWVHGLPEKERTLLNARLFPVINPFPDRHMSPLCDGLWLAGVQIEHSHETMQKRYLPMIMVNVLGLRPRRCSPRSIESNRWHKSWRLSLKEIMSCVDAGTEFHCRRQLFFEIGRRQVKAALEGGTNTCFLPFLKTCAIEGFHKEILASMDEIACKSDSMGVAGRTLACIADVLGAMAGEKAGLRSGPAQNIAWKEAFQLLENKRIKDGVKAMAVERSKWMDRPDLLIRAARHYEGAEQILRRHAVMTAQQYIDFKKVDCPSMDQWVVAEAPVMGTRYKSGVARNVVPCVWTFRVRLDFSGGWTDTPPIAYEHGGVVTNAAIQLNGQKPLQVKAKRIPELQIVIEGGPSGLVVCQKSDDMADYFQPHAPGALVKACFCAAKLVDLSSSQSLADQLKEQYGGGFEIHSMADVPYGSGLGTSSILAGVVMAAVLRAAGRTADIASLVHAVMVVEQMLTCGGGWQDNVGGLAPGFKIARSSPALPIKVKYQELKVSSSFVEELNKCLVLVYTGKTRLAKNLLQNVVRNWYGREPNIVKVVDDLANNADDIANAIVEGDLSRFGQCVSNYREQKRLIAPGTEPEMIRRMMEAVQPHAYGQCLAGAGGGGFLCVISKSADDASKVKDILHSQFSESVEFYQVSIDNEGLVVRVEEL